MTRNSDLDPELEQRYHEDLLATLGRIDQLEAEKAELRKAISGCLDEEWARVRVLRDLLEGRVSEQAALPGLEGPGERESRIGAVLRRAIDALENITGVSAEPDEKKGKRAKTPLGAEVERVLDAAADLGRSKRGERTTLSLNGGPEHDLTALAEQRDARKAAAALDEARQPKRKGGRPRV